jgi:hypothetical protein
MSVSDDERAPLLRPPPVNDHRRSTDTKETVSVRACPRLLQKGLIGSSHTV